jgi:hypothetical protein
LVAVVRAASLTTSAAAAQLYSPATSCSSSSSSCKQYKSGTKAVQKRYKSVTEAVQTGTAGSKAVQQVYQPNLLSMILYNPRLIPVATVCACCTCALATSNKGTQPSADDIVQVKRLARQPLARQLSVTSTR